MNPNPELPNEPPIPAWAANDPLVSAARKNVNELRLLLERGIAPGSRPRVEAALAKEVADLTAAIERCRPPEPTPQPEVTFERLKELVPELAHMERRLVERAKEYGRKRWWCANACWFGYGRFRCFDGGESCRQWLPRLVGRHRPKNANDPNDELLRSSEAYDCAYDALYLSLPGCKDCACM
jgi:hypothetical protein